MICDVLSVVMVMMMIIIIIIEALAGSHQLAAAAAAADSLIPTVFLSSALPVSASPSSIRPSIPPSWYWRPLCEAVPPQSTSTSNAVSEG